MGREMARGDNVIAVEVAAMLPTDVTSGKKEDDWTDVPFWQSQRVLTAGVAFLGFVVFFVQRVNMSVAVVCMVGDEENNPHSGNLSVTSKSNDTLHIAGYKRVDYRLGSEVIDNLTLHFDEVTGHQGQGREARGHEGSEFNWDKNTQGMLLSSFFYGLLVLQIPGGVLSERHGPRRVITFTMLPVALLGALCPLAARVSPYLLAGVRAAVGVGESAFVPAMHALFARWVPMPERSKLVGVAWSGNYLGSALTFPFVSWLCHRFGWESVFYVTSALGLAWVLLWLLLVFDAPALSPRVSALERRYIEAHTRGAGANVKTAVPWRAILTSSPFWAVLCAHVAGNWGLYSSITMLPSYFHEVLGTDIHQNGLYSMLPFLVMWLTIFLAGWAADALIGRRYLSRLHTRKLFGCLGLWLPAACLLGLAWAPGHGAAPLLLVCGAVGMNGLTYAGFLVTHGELAPRLAGTLMGLTNMAATLPGLAAPALTAALTPNKTREEWQSAFLVSAAVHVAGGLIYLVFGQTNVQPWAEPPSQELKVVGGPPEIKIITPNGSALQLGSNLQIVKAFGEKALLNSSEKISAVGDSWKGNNNEDQATEQVVLLKKNNQVFDK